MGCRELPNSFVEDSSVSDTASTATLSFSRRSSCVSTYTGMPGSCPDIPETAQESADCKTSSEELSRLKDELRKMQELRLHDFSSSVKTAGTLIWLAFLVFLTVCAGKMVTQYGCDYVSGAVLLVYTGLVMLTVHLGTAEGSLNRRRIEVLWTAFIVFLRFRWTKLRCHTLKEGSAPRELLWEETHRIVAFLAYESFLSWRGFWVKVGQYVSTRHDVFPEPYIEWLSKLQDQMPAAPLSEVQQTLEEELGSELAASLKLQEPALASASIGQVHKAKLFCGSKVPQEVVVKIQHRGIDKVMTQDVRTLELILRVVAWVEPDYDFRPIISEWKAASVRELDFETESLNTVRARDTLVRADLSDKVYVPAIHELFTRRRVLVMEYIDGVKVDLVQSKLPEADPEVIMQRIIDAFALQLHVDGHFNGDPHPGNILVERKTLRPVLLDWGLCKTFEESSRRAFAKMVYAVDAKDIWTLMDSFEEVGFKFRADAEEGSNGVQALEPAAALEVMRFVLRDPTPKDEGKELVMKRVEVDQKKNQQNKELKRRDPVEALTGEVLFFFRTVDCLQGLSSALGVRPPFLKTLAFRARAALLGPPGSPHDVLSGLPEPPPAGFKGPLDEKLHKLLCEFVKNGRVSGAQVCVVGQRGDDRHEFPILADAACGLLGPLDPRPVSSDTLFVLHSLSHLPLTLTLLHLLDQGSIVYDDKLGKLWPGFNNNGKGEITVAHILARTSGLWHCFPQSLTLGHLLSLDKMMEAVETSTPGHLPGASQAAHYWTFGWLLAGLCRHGAGRELDSCWEEAMHTLADCYGKELLLPIPSHLTSNSKVAQVEKPPTEGVDVGELVGAMARLEGELDDDTSDACSCFMKPICSKEHLLDPMLYNLPKAKHAVSLAGQNVHSTARAMANLLVRCAPHGQPATFVQRALAESAGQLSHVGCSQGLNQSPNVAKDLLASAIPLPGIVSHLFQRFSKPWPLPGCFGTYGLQRLEGLSGAGGFAPESGAFAYWLPDSASGPCAVCLLVSRVDAAESGLGNAVVQVVCKESKKAM